MNDQPHPGQLHIAEQDLCAWLAYPTELDARPDRIELLGTADVVTPAGPSDLFVFRFRTSEPHWAAAKGWMVGVAGPYARAHQPNARALGHTFSKLAREADQSVLEHITDLVGTVGRFHRAARESTDAGGPATDPIG